MGILDDERIEAASNLRANSLRAPHSMPPVDNWHRGDWMLTFTGHRFYPMSPRSQDVDLLDIAHSLAMQCRYNGHVDRFYSVAEHCCLMADQFTDPDLARWALLHDATEAYVGDMIRPLKLNMSAYRAVEDEVMRTIAMRFGLHHEIDWRSTPVSRPDLSQMPKVVKEVDTRILLTERNALMSNYKESGHWAMEGLGPLDTTIYAWSPEDAQSQYLKRAEVLGIS